MTVFTINVNVKTKEDLIDEEIKTYAQKLSSGSAQYKRIININAQEQQYNKLKYNAPEVKGFYEKLYHIMLEDYATDWQDKNTGIRVPADSLNGFKKVAWWQSSDEYYERISDEEKDKIKNQYKEKTGKDLEIKSILDPGFKEVVKESKKDEDSASYYAEYYKYEASDIFKWKKTGKLYRVNCIFYYIGLKERKTNTYIEEYVLFTENYEELKFDEEGELDDETVDNLTQQDKEFEEDKNIKVFLSASADDGDPRNPVTFVDVLDDVLTDLKNYGPTDMSDVEAKEVEEITTKILSIVTSIGMVITIIIPAVLGLKYMLGSVEEKAEYKKDLVPYIVGAILLFGICAIIRVLQAFGDKITTVI